MPFRTNEAELRTDFLEFLMHDLDYPKDSILMDHLLPSFSEKFPRRADIIVTDPDSAVTLALIELRVHKENATQEDAYLQIQQYLREFDAPPPAFLVMNEVRSPYGYSIFTLREDNKWVEIPRHEFPSFRALVARTIADEKTLITRERQVRFDVVKTACYISAVLLFILFFLSVFNVFTASNIQLGMLGGVIALVVLPNAARLKVLGFEFERLKK